MLTDLELLRQLAALMGWTIYTEQEGDYDRWQRHLVNQGGVGSCFVDLDGRVWIYDNPAPYLNAHERLWRPLHSMDDAWMIVQKLRDAWTAATEGVSGLDPDFPRPFDDTYFFDLLRRNADRRWPWAFLYVTPRAICEATLKAYGVDL